MPRLFACCLLFDLTLLTVAGAQDAKPPRLPKDTMPEELPLDVIPLGLAAQRQIPADNQLTPQRVRLGRRLFFDPVLSKDRTVACASCHDPAHGFATKAAKAVGLLGRAGPRNAPSLLNRAYGVRMFWDGRAESLEEQALKPIDNPLELGATIDEAMKRLQADASYRDAFAAAYDGGVTRQNLARALASFQRVLLSGNSRVDEFQAAKAPTLTSDEKHGLWLYESKGRCWRCHSGPNYTDETFHNTGVSWGKKPADLGLEAFTKDPAHRGRFKTPTLRDVARTAPYMHDGSITTLKQVIDFYNRGGVKNPHLDPMMKPLGLTPKEVDQLVAFLEALNGRAPDRKLPATP